MAEDANPRPAEDFASWVAKTRTNYIGHDLRENESSYIPYRELETYWTVLRISAVLHAYDRPLPFDIKSIQSDYLRIFSTLVCTGTTRLLLGLILTNNLDDHHWPIVHYPNTWPRHNHETVTAFDIVKRTQWIFFPFDFKTSRLNNSELDPDCILPIGDPETISQYGSSCIYKIKIHDGYNSFVSSMMSG